MKRDLRKNMGKKVENHGEYINTSIVENFFKSADQFPDKTAIIAAGESITYLQLKLTVLGAAQCLIEHDVQAGDRILIKAIPSIPYVVALLATHMCSAVTVPIEKVLQFERVMEIKRMVCADFVIVDFESSENDFFTLVQLYKEAKIRVDEGKVNTKNITFPNSDSLGELMFTTGTTGSSKGIELSYRNVLAAAQNTLECTGMKTSDVNLIPAPLNHSFGIRRMYGSLAIGSTAVLLNGVTSVRLFFKAIEEYKVTSIILVPAAMEYVFLMAGDKLTEYKDQIRFIELGADNVSNTLKTKIMTLMPKTNLFNIYGSTEAGCVIGINYNKHPDKLNSIGKDAVNAKIMFTNENGDFVKAVSKEKCGLFTISGAMVMKGYYNDPELTSSTVKNGYLYTSDIGYRDDDGFIFLIGRKGDVINVGGNKVSPVEVEQVANQYPSVVESACVGCPDPNGLLRQVPKLYIVLKSGSDFSVNDLKEFIASKLEIYKVPLVYVETESIPKTTSGKLQRSKLV